MPSLFALVHTTSGFSSTGNTTLERWMLSVADWCSMWDKMLCPEPLDDVMPDRRPQPRSGPGQIKTGNYTLPWLPAIMLRPSHKQYSVYNLKLWLRIHGWSSCSVTTAPFPSERCSWFPFITKDVFRCSAIASYSHTGRLPSCPSLVQACAMHPRHSPNDLLAWICTRRCRIRRRWIDGNYTQQQPPNNVTDALLY